MTKIAFIFPGQGSQSIGMGVALAERYPEAKAIFEQAADGLGFDLLSICRNGPDEKLRETAIAQPALYVTGCAAAAVLRASGIELFAAAGHSIGEYAALTAANVFDFSEGLRLVGERSQLMQQAAQSVPGGMAAVLGLDRAALQSLCQEIQAQDGVCVPVNINSPEQIVVAGERKAIERLVTLAPERGAKRVIALNVSGAFHSPLMKEAAKRMGEILSTVSFRRAAVPVVMNADGRSHMESRDIQECLSRQLDSPVEWVRSVETLKAAGCTTFVECGSGRVLSGLLKRIDKQLQSFSTETVEAVTAAQEALGVARRPS